LAKCNLDFDIADPKFVIRGDAPSSNLLAGLKELQTKLATNHQSSHFVNHPMPGFPQYQNKIWKWDFAPAGDSGSTRKGWRLFAYVPDPKAPEPIPARAFLCYDKDEEPSGNPAKFLALRLKDYLSGVVRVEAKPERFKRQVLQDGTIVLICHTCYEVIRSPDHAEADIIESTHECRQA
jgi:hypothetical protein